MKIIDRIKPDTQFISLEFFPPKLREDWPSFFQTVERLATLQPLFASVTYGAGGSTHDNSLDIVTRLKCEHGLEAMAHLTCIGSAPNELLTFLERLADAGVDNVLALRGDRPTDMPPEAAAATTLQHASDLTAFIRSSHPGFGLAAAGYPETHPEALSPESDLQYLKLKFENGADFAITQLFFDNKLYHDFVARATTAGITKPIIPGILPVVSLKVIKRIVSLCGASIPAEFLAALEEADQRGGSAEVQKIGLAHARRQAQELLASGVPGVHIYTLNRSELVLELVDGLLP
ncbi:MAG TPA: methylenetetrahydrofolate reductase [NAD(P)H] [Desulfuromonadales bacterium]|nr:methylenetetrahydrofolate reductase [NAD(P)H] [Desulfuromonadales bacterium]